MVRKKEDSRMILNFFLLDPMDGKCYPLRRLKTEEIKILWVIGNQYLLLIHIKFHISIRHSSGSVTNSESQW